MPAARYPRTFWDMRWSTRTDIVLGLVCCAAGQVEVAVTAPDPVVALGAALATLPITWQRRAPLIGVVAIAVAWAVVHLRLDDISEPFFFFAALPVFYSLAAYRSAACSLAGGALLLTTVAVTTIEDLAFLALQFALVWFAGCGVRTYRERAEHLRLLAARLARERDATERLAVAEEHQRMAAELHGTVSQAVRLMASQANDAEQSLDAEPHRARAALAAVQDTGRGTIAQLQQMLRLLRDPASSPTADPGPSILVLGLARWRLPVPRSAWSDVLLAVFLVATSDTYLFIANPIGLPNLVVMTAAAVVAAVAITIRRRVPVSALALAAATIGVELLIFAAATPAPIVATMVTMYSVAANTPKPRAVATTAAVVNTLGVVLLLQVSCDSMLVMFVWLGIPRISHRLVLAHRRQTEQLHTLTTRLIREHDARTRLAVRDLHDSVTHAVSVMVMQAGAAEQVIDTAPAKARTAIRAVRDQGRQAHHDLCRLLGLLAEDTAAPPPSLARLDTLVAQAGLPVTLVVSGEPVQLPTGLDISAYRMVQEGLTNTRKHAGPVPATVTVDYTPDALTIEVRDLGCDPSPRPAPCGGHGLLGMRERIEQYGGTLETGPRSDGGFAVRARIPLNPTLS